MEAIPAAAGVPNPPVDQNQPNAHPGQVTADAYEKYKERRHAFILQYYAMAVRDLDRHLGIGWQSIALVAGTVAAISLGEKGDLPVPVAVSGALAVGFWGMLNILDADYWATRAIAFLANVEAVYLSEEDRSVFNPYIGRHPPFKMLDSLRYQFSAVVAFICITLVYFAWKVLVNAGGLTPISHLVAIRPWYQLLFWSLPILVVAVFSAQVILSRYTRVRNYLSFVVDCPGPGMAATRQSMRDVALEDIRARGNLIEGASLQEALRNDLSVSVQKWRRRLDISYSVSITLVAAVVLLLFTRSFWSLLAGAIVGALAFAYFTGGSDE
jgi:hypothetical protein